MLNFFKNIYYTLYKWQLRVNRTIDWHEQNAVLLLSIFIGFNAMTMFFLYECIFNNSIDIIKINFINVGLVYIPFIVILDYVFIFGGKHKKIVEEFDKYDNSILMKKKLQARLYFILSFIFLVIAGVIYNLVKLN